MNSTKQRFEELKKSSDKHGGAAIATESQEIKELAEKEGIETFSTLNFICHAFLKDKISEQKMWESARELFETKKKNGWKEVYGEQSVEAKQGLTTWKAWKQAIQPIIDSKLPELCGHNGCLGKVLKIKESNMCQKCGWGDMTV